MRRYPCTRGIANSPYFRARRRFAAHPGNAASTGRIGRAQDVASTGAPTSPKQPAVGRRNAAARYSRGSYAEA